MIALAVALLLQAQAKPGEPIPCLPGPCPGVEAKTKHDTAKNSVNNVRAQVSDPIPGVDDPVPKKKAQAAPLCGQGDTTKPCPDEGKGTPK